MLLDGQQKSEKATRNTALLECWRECALYCEALMLSGPYGLWCKGCRGWSSGGIVNLPVQCLADALGYKGVTLHDMTFLKGVVRSYHERLGSLLNLQSQDQYSSGNSHPQQSPGDVSSA